MTVLPFQQCRLEVDHRTRYIQTVFEDGTYAPATPNYEPSDVQRAHDLGYGGDCWQMCMDHETMHTWVAECMGFPYSLILWNVAHGGRYRWPDGGREEEGYVTSMQRFLRRGDMDDLVHGFFDSAREVTGLAPDVITAQARQLLADVRMVGDVNP